MESTTFIHPETQEELGTLYHGDCLEVLRNIERNTVEIAVTSPPYNLCKNTWPKPNSSKTSQEMDLKKELWYDDDVPEWLYQGQQQALVHELLRICKSSVFYNHKVRYAWHSRNIYRTQSQIYHPVHWLSQFPIWCEIIWDRCGIGNPTRRYHVQEERIYQIQKPRKWNNPNGLTNIWKISPTKNDGHICSYPPQLVENCMLPTTEEGDTVFDPYMGSGTTAVVAIHHKRKFIGSELNKDYYELAVKNINQAIKKRFSQEQFFSMFQ